MIHTERLIKEFEYLVSFDSPSFHEKEIAGYLKKKLEALNMVVSEDEAGSVFTERGEGQSTSNIYARLKGNTEGEAILFSSHMDTVSPGIGKKAVIHEDGTITSEGSTVLGADDVSGIVAILEAIQVIQENNLSHPDIEVVFTVAEEPYCEGSRFLDYSKINAKYGYVLDLVGPVGRAATAAPSILSCKVKVQGKAAHAGFAPETGINALNIAVNALHRMPTGHIDEETTVNFGTIQGGSGRNIVPEDILIEGEIRSLSHEKAKNEAEKIKEVFEAEAKKLNGSVEVNITEHIRAYKVDENETVAEHFKKAVGGLARCSMAEYITTFGGSDANRFNEHGIKTIVCACAMENCHSTTEYTSVSELEKAAELTLQLMQIA